MLGCSLLICFSFLAAYVSKNAHTYDIYAHTHTNVQRTGNCRYTPTATASRAPSFWTFLRTAARGCRLNDMCSPSKRPGLLITGGLQHTRDHILVHTNIHT